MNDNDNQRSLNIVIQNLGTQIEELENKVVGSDPKNDYVHHINDLKRQKREAEQKLTALETGSTGPIETITSSIQQAWTDVKEAVNDTFARIR